MGILDVLSSAPTKNPYAGTLSDEAWSYYEKMQSRQRVGQVMRTLGNTLSNAAWGRSPTGGGGGRSSGGGQDELLRMMRMNQMLEARQDRDAARQDKDAERQRKARISELLGANTQGPTRALPGGYGVGPVTQQSLMPQDKANRAKLLSLMALGDPNAAIKTALEKQKQPKYSRPIAGRDPTGKDVYMRFRQKGGPGEVVAGLTPIPKATGGPSRAQKASDQEIDTARAQMRRLQSKIQQSGGNFYDELQRRMNTKTNAYTGMPEPDYNSHWGRLAWLAAQSKSGGGDREQAFWMQTIMFPGATQPPPSIPGATAAAGPLAAAAATPGTPAPAVSSRPDLPVPRYPGMPRATAGETPFMEGQTVPINGKSHEVVKVNPDGTYIVMDLATGETSFARIKQ